MKSETNSQWGANIERGKIKTVNDGKYTVASYDRPGVTAWELEAMNGTYTVGDTVYFFVFEDGKGLIVHGA